MTVDPNATLGDLSRQMERIQRDKVQREGKAQSAAVQTAEHLLEIRKQSDRQTQLLADIKALLERMVPQPATPPRQPDRSALAYIDK